ncbi:MAG TPA: hypothetical protein VF059_06550 [Casimicrobiaceae bacterium]
MRARSVQRAIWWVIWPGFVAACVAEFVFFALFDPLDFNMRINLSREAVYTWGFIAFWLLGILSSAITLLLVVTPASGRTLLAGAFEANNDNHGNNDHAGSR